MSEKKCLKNKEQIEEEVSAMVSKIVELYQQEKAVNISKDEADNQKYDIDSFSKPLAEDKACLKRYDKALKKKVKSLWNDLDAIKEERHISDILKNIKNISDLKEKIEAVKNEKENANTQLENAKKDVFDDNEDIKFLESLGSVGNLHGRDKDAAKVNSIGYKSGFSGNKVSPSFIPMKVLNKVKEKQKEKELKVNSIQTEFDELTKLEEALEKIALIQTQESVLRDVIDKLDSLESDTDKTQSDTDETPESDTDETPESDTDKAHQYISGEHDTIRVEC